MSFDAARVAALLAAARTERRIVLPLPAELAPATVEQGAAAQYALAASLGALPPAGFKIGATGRRMQAYLGLPGPAAGFMQACNVYRGHADLRFADFIRPGVECEVAVRLSRDLLPGPCSAEQAAAAVGELVAAIEVVENRYDDLATLGTPTLIADQVYHGAAVVGETGGIDGRGLDLLTLRGRISIDGAERDSGVTADLMGHPMNCLAWLAGSAVAAAFGGLKAGQVVMLGSVTPPVWLEAPARVTVAFPPLPSVSVTLG
jgi:2-keto-4-pentenoate hydratase